MPANNIHISKFKSKAKALFKSVMSGNPTALQMIEPYFEHPEAFKLTQAQLVIARTNRCASWKELISRDDWLACSFCGKWQYEISKLIAGPKQIYVCNECVELCNEIIQDETIRGERSNHSG